MKPFLLLGTVIPFLSAGPSLAQAPGSSCELICVPPEECVCKSPPPSPPCSVVCENPGERLESMECKCVKDEQ